MEIWWHCDGACHRKHFKNLNLLQHVCCFLTILLILILYGTLTLILLLFIGLWSLTYEQELTTPLHITAGRGFVDCLSLLLQRGANVDLAPGGTTALHEACESCQAECAKLLLIYGANANAVSEDGLMPLHVCTSSESFE